MGYPKNLLSRTAVPPSFRLNGVVLHEYFLWNLEENLKFLLYFATGILLILKHCVTDVTLERACGSVGLSVASGLCHVTVSSPDLPMTINQSTIYLDGTGTYFEFTLLFYTLWPLAMDRKERLASFKIKTMILIAAVFRDDMLSIWRCRLITVNRLSSLSIHIKLFST